VVVLRSTIFSDQTNDLAFNVQAEQQTNPPATGHTGPCWSSLMKLRRDPPTPSPHPGRASKQMEPQNAHRSARLLRDGLSILRSYAEVNRVSASAPIFPKARMHTVIPRTHACSGESCKRRSRELSGISIWRQIPPLAHRRLHPRKAPPLLQDPHRRVPYSLIPTSLLPYFPLWDFGLSFSICHSPLSPCHLVPLSPPPPTLTVGV
jgi:hypothetical protein